MPVANGDIASELARRSSDQCLAREQLLAQELTLTRKGEISAHSPSGPDNIGSARLEPCSPSGWRRESRSVWGGRVDRVLARSHPWFACRGVRAGDRTVFFSPRDRKASCRERVLVLVVGV